MKKPSRRDIDTLRTCLKLPIFCLCFILKYIEMAAQLHRIASFSVLLCLSIAVDFFPARFQYENLPVISHFGSFLDH